MKTAEEWAIRLTVATVGAKAKTKYEETARVFAEAMAAARAEGEAAGFARGIEAAKEFLEGRARSLAASDLTISAWLWNESAALLALAKEPGT